MLIFGDSLSAGYGVPLADAWFSLLKTRLSNREYAVDVVNASVSGETTLGGRNRLSEALNRHQPDWLLLELGANDGLRGLPIEDMRANLQAMISLAKSRGVSVILVGMRLPPNYGTIYTKAFADMYTTLAQRNDCALIPFMLQDIATNQEMMQADGLHPNSAAQSLVLSNLWPVLEAVLTAKSPSKMGVR